MNKLRLLIVDDYESNRAVLQAICRKMEGFEIREATDGLEAIEVVEEWRPHIILMDIMMPRLDGFEATKIIKSRYPDIIIMVVTAAADKQLEENFAEIGVTNYIHKPVDKELMRFKLKSFAALLHSKEGNFAIHSPQAALNPFCSDIRHFTTNFEITDADSMMDFGMWILMRCDSTGQNASLHVDTAIELFYQIMRYNVVSGESLNISVEENFEEIFVTLQFETPVELQPKTEALIELLGSMCISVSNCVHVRLGMAVENSVMTKTSTVKPAAVSVVDVKKEQLVEKASEIKATVEKKPESVTQTVSDKEKRVLPTDEQAMLRKSFTNKTSAMDYVNDIGGDVLDEIRDLASLDEEWRGDLNDIENEPTVANIYGFVDNVLGRYTHAINAMFEFTALGYALSALGVSIKENAEKILQDEASLKKMLLLMENLGYDLVSWREHIFELQDTADIHYLDSSFFSSCIQIEGIITNKEIQAADDDDSFELF